MSTKREISFTWVNGKSFEAMHREMWTWLAHNPAKSKIEFFKYQYPEVEPRDWPMLRCFACEYEQRLFINGMRKMCPLQGKCGVGTDAGCLRGVYKAWADADKLSTKSYLASKIAKMRWTNYTEDVEDSQ